MITPDDDTDELDLRGLCENGHCTNKAVENCVCRFCTDCCDEKCSLQCERQIALFPVDELPSF